MKKLAIAITAVALIGTPAFAADMPVKAPPSAPAPVYSWTGFYVGANAGYGWRGDRTVNFVANNNDAGNLQGNIFCSPGSPCPPPPVSYNINGGLGGLQAGYNYQVNQNWLVGFETDFDWSHISGTGYSNIAIVGFPANATLQASENISWFGTVRGRVGFLATNNVLLYGTGGLAYGHVSENAALNALGRFGSSGNMGGTINFSFFCNPGLCAAANSSHTAIGWTAGGGLEYALWNNLSVKLEYLWVNLNTGDALTLVLPQAMGQPPGTLSSSFTAYFSNHSFNVVRVGLNWKFN